MMRYWVLVMLVSLLAGCASDSGGDVEVIVTTESVITDGMTGGTARGEVVDGWDIIYDKFIVVIGEVRIAQNEGLERYSGKVRVVDLRRLGREGLLLERFESMEATRWHHVSYATPIPTPAAKRDETVAERDYQTMLEKGWTHWISGELRKPDGEACPSGTDCEPAPVVRFDIATATPTRFSSCAQPLGIPGLAVNDGGTTIAALSLRGDHLFYNGFISGHSQLELRAQWLADADLDMDGTVTTDELGDIPAEDVLPPVPAGPYSYTGSPKQIRTALNFVEGQMTTLGHFDGEGECAWTSESSF